MKKTQNDNEMNWTHENSSKSNNNNNNANDTVEPEWYTLWWRQKYARNKWKGIYLYSVLAQQIFCI